MLNKHEHGLNDYIFWLMLPLSFIFENSCIVCKEATNKLNLSSQKTFFLASLFLLFILRLPFLHSFFFITITSIYNWYLWISVKLTNWPVRRLWYEDEDEEKEKWGEREGNLRGQNDRFATSLKKMNYL